ncbi:MAG TPA: isoprenylcysteine carboxylmethyltransferase family protein [Candidatus Binataceae bacterium]|nr:isoprenylcysteine carboxylmethyltransferase family protein [Candidatus Binataceae bacterium]
MVIGERAYLAILAFVAAERVVELFISRRHAAHAFAHGGFESGQAHYRAMVALHAALLVACAVESLICIRRIPAALSTGALIVAASAQMLRYWAVWTLGERWSTRIIVIPGALPVTSGPYRFMRHPNYLAVVLEVAALPLIRANWYTAIGFSIANAIVLAVRIPAEERAMGASYREAFASRRRFIL